VIFDDVARFKQRHDRGMRGGFVVERSASLRAVRPGDRAMEAGVDLRLDAQVEVALKRLAEWPARSPMECQISSASRNSPAGIRVGPRTVKLVRRPARGTEKQLPSFRG
jgi:hypothetical protein